MNRYVPFAPVAVVIALLGTACGGDDDLDTEAAAGVIDDLFDDIDFDDDSFVELDGCLIDDAEELLEQVFADLDEDGIDQTLRRGEFRTAAYDDEGSGERYLDCSFDPDPDAAVDDEAVYVGFYFLEAPRDFERFAGEFVGADEDPEVDVDVDEQDEFRGGSFFHNCVDFGGGGGGFCEVDWIDEELLVGVYVASDDADRIDLDEVRASFREILPTIIADLADDEADDVEIVDTIGS